MADKDKIEDRRVRCRPNAAQLFGQIVARLSTLAVCRRYYSKFEVIVSGGRDDGLDEAAGLVNGRGVSICPSVAANTQKMALTPVHQPDAADDFALSVQRPIAAKEPASQDKPDTEGAIIRKRLENFRANQERFRREREEYCTTTMAKARANQWTPQSRHHR
jgi:hypothetical protein